MTDRVDVVRQLLTTPPPEFVAARNRTAKELRKAGEKEAATMVAGLRRPSLPDWAFNVVARENPDAVGEFVDASDAVRDAQAAAIEGREGADVRTVLHELRQRTAGLVTLARAVVDRSGQKSTTASTGELTARLAEIAGNATAAGHLRSGVLGAQDPGAVDLFADLVPTARRARRAPAREAAKAARAVDRDDGAARRGRARALADAERRQVAAEKSLTSAEAAVRKAGVAADRARQRLEQAGSELAQAQDRLEEAERTRELASDELADAEAAVTIARQAADG